MVRRLCFLQAQRGNAIVVNHLYFNFLAVRKGRFVFILHAMSFKMKFYLQYSFKNVLVHVSHSQVITYYVYFYDNCSQYEKIVRTSAYHF